MLYIYHVNAPIIWYAVEFRYVSQLLRKFPIKCVSNQLTLLTAHSLLSCACIHPYAFNLRNNITAKWVSFYSMTWQQHQTTNSNWTKTLVLVLYCSVLLCFVLFCLVVFSFAIAFIYSCLLLPFMNNIVVWINMFQIHTTYTVYCIW